MADVDWDALVVVARVARTHGLRGDVFLDSETDFPDDRFRPGSRLLMRDATGVRAMIVRGLKFFKGRPIVGFEGIDSIESAELLAGRELRIDAGDLIELPPGTYYHHDLVGCRVESEDGTEVGTVTKVDGAGVATRLVVDGGAEEQLVPLVDEICRVIDPAARRIVIAAPPGLLGINTVSGRRRVRKGKSR